MPELPEVEVLVRHLHPRLVGEVIRSASVTDRRMARPTPPARLMGFLNGARIIHVQRRAKFILFDLQPAGSAVGSTTRVISHLGMTGRMFLQPVDSPLPRHTVVHWEQGDRRFVFTDPRRFGRFTLDDDSLQNLGPEPLDPDFMDCDLQAILGRSRQPVKVRLMDPTRIAGIGNIYASEILFVARIHPSTRCCDLTQAQGLRLRDCIRKVLEEAVRLGSGLDLDFPGGEPGTGGVFYYGSRGAKSDSEAPEHFRVYDREGEPCRVCESRIRREVEAARSTFFCPRCQPPPRNPNST